MLTLRLKMIQWVGNADPKAKDDKLVGNPDPKAKDDTVGGQS